MLARLAHQFSAALLRGERAVAGRLVLDAVAGGMPVQDVYLHVFQPSLHEIGRLWQADRISVAQEHYCTAATQVIMSQLYEHVFAAARNGRALVATSVEGNLHEIGVRMVADFFEMDGWDTYYLGANTPHADVVRSVNDRGAEVLAVSAALAEHVAGVGELIRAVRTDPVASAVTVLVGGNPFNQDRDLWRAVGADGYAADAQSAITTANAYVAARA